jgi:hypothetical protein
MYEKYMNDGRQEALIVVSYGCDQPTTGAHILSTNLIPTRPGYGINVVDIVCCNICTKIKKLPEFPYINNCGGVKIDFYIHVSNEPPNSGAKIMWFCDVYRDKDSEMSDAQPMSPAYDDISQQLYADPLVEFITWRGDLILEKNCDFRPKTITDEKMRPILDMIEEYRTSRVKDLYRFNKLNGSMFVHF